MPENKFQHFKLKNNIVTNSLAKCGNEIKCSQIFDAKIKAVYRDQRKFEASKMDARKHLDEIRLPK